MSPQLILRELNEFDEQAFLAGYEDWKNEDLIWYSFVWKPGMSHAEHLKILADQKDQSKIPSQFVPSTMLYGFVNDEIIGRLNIRHTLNDNLRLRGGHVGYSVSPKHRKKGYASEMFQLGLKYCQKLGLNKILVTCDNLNIPSWRIIEKFGGFLENRIFEEAKSNFVRRYWVSTDLAASRSIETKDKVLAYITREKNSKLQILVFEHDKQFSEAGIQVPAGTLEKNEDKISALLREIEEETGLTDKEVEVVKQIDEYTMFREQQNCFNHRFVFHLKIRHELPDSWTHKVTGDGIDSNMNFHFTWIHLEEAQASMAGDMGQSLCFL